MRKTVQSICAVAALFTLGGLAACDSSEKTLGPVAENNLRAPAYPLVTVDPYTSAWSFSDRLTDDPVRHWTGKPYPLVGAVRVDGEVYRFLGTVEKGEGDGSAPFARVAQQLSATVMPTSTYYSFSCGPVQLNLAFTAPLLMDDLDRLSTPINYMTYQVVPTDGDAHEVQLYLEASPLWAIDVVGQAVDNSREVMNGMTYLRAASRDQQILGKKGDDVRIDWGSFFLASKDGEQISMNVGEYNEVKEAFANKGQADPDRAAPLDKPVSLAYSKDLGTVSTATSDYVMIGYDDLYSIQYFNENRMAYWKHDGAVDIYQAFEQAAGQYPALMERCQQFDRQLMADAVAAGGQEYAELCALVYRQAIAAHKLVTDREGNLLFFSKENFSNGSIGTVDITYPSSPLFLLYNPELLKGMMNPIFHYSESGRWDKPFAAHDVGTYPLANGQTYGGDMPIEESGNMLILSTALAVVEGNADYAKKHWTVLTTWADYLLANGLDPANQLCTDDFAGHFAHNTNLSIKAILGIAGYGKLAEMLGDTATAEKYTQAARGMATQWMEMADAGDHYRLTFDQPVSWSQKYNLIWDRLLGLSIFPKELAEKEMSFYLQHQNRYGLPLDNRKTYSKSDWILWTACLTGNPEHFRQLLAPVYRYADETTTRMPMSDWYETTDGKSVGFRARSVVGGYFMRMLEKKLLEK